MAPAWWPSWCLLGKQGDSCLPFFLNAPSLLLFRFPAISRPSSGFSISANRQPGVRCQAPLCKTPSSLEVLFTYLGSRDKRSYSKGRGNTTALSLLLVPRRSIHSLAFIHPPLSIHSTGKYWLSARPHSRHRSEQKVSCSLAI